MNFRSALTSGSNTMTRIADPPRTISDDTRMMSVVELNSSGLASANDRSVACHLRPIRTQALEHLSGGCIEPPEKWIQINSHQRMTSTMTTKISFPANCSPASRSCFYWSPRRKIHAGTSRASTRPPGLPPRSQRGVNCTHVKRADDNQEFAHEAFSTGRPRITTIKRKC